MQLSAICEADVDDLREILLQAYGSKHQAAIDKLSEFADRQKSFTEPGGFHTVDSIVAEIEQGKRLASEIPSEEVEDPKGLIVIKRGRYALVARPQDKDILALLQADGGSAVHIVRGIAFGYGIDAVMPFYKKRAEDDQWNARLRSLGIKLSSDVNGGYSSGVRDNIGSITVEPSDRYHLEKVIGQLGELRYVYRWCPYHYQYVMVSGSRPEWADDFLEPYECDHSTEDASDRPANKRPWYKYSVKLSQ